MKEATPRAEDDSQVAADIMPKIRFSENVGKKKLELAKAFDDFSQAEKGFTVRQTDYLAGAKINLEFLRKHVSGPLEGICAQMIREDRNLLQIDFITGLKIIRFLRPKSFIRFNGMDLEYVEPSSDIFTDQDKQKIINNWSLDGLWNRGKETREAVSKFGELSRKEVGLKVLAGLDSISGIR